MAKCKAIRQRRAPAGSSVVQVWLELRHQLKQIQGLQERLTTLKEALAEEVRRREQEKRHLEEIFEEEHSHHV